MENEKFAIRNGRQSTAIEIKKILIEQNKIENLLFCSPPDIAPVPIESIIYLFDEVKGFTKYQHGEY